jgi:ketosteroid isomerase-like protein
MFKARISTKIALALSALLAITAACTGTAAPPPPTNPGNGTTIARTPTPVPASDEEAIRQLINAECEAVVQQDVDRLQAMWAPNGVVTDANHTQGNTGDDVTWKGWDALRDRYVNLIFPSNPTFCEHPDIQVTINGNNATATSSVKIGVTNCQNCNQWTFTKGSDGWHITGLTYNLNPQ